jgi:hypothetical protein
MPQKQIEKEVESTEIVEVDGKWVKKIVTKTTQEPAWEQVDLYDEEGNVIGKHTIPIEE